MKHTDSLKQCLAKRGIYDLERDCYVEGKEGNVIWMDEMGQFFNYLLRRGSARLTTTAKGKKAKTAGAENRGQFSVDAACGGDLHMYDPHLLFAQDSLTGAMAPDCVKAYPHMLCSTTPKGCQTGVSFLQRLISIEAEARAHGIKGDIVFATDGHASRYATFVLRWLLDSKDHDGCDLGHDMYITPPNSTGTCCILDQLFAMLHKQYGDSISDIKKDYGLAASVGKVEAVSAICHVWHTWASYESKRRAWKVCGVGIRQHDGTLTISVDAIPTKMFALAEKLAADEAEFEENNATPEKQTSQLALPSSPPASIPRDTMEYWQAKAACSAAIMGLQAAQIAAEKERAPQPLKDGVLTANWYKPMPRKQKNRRITQQWGSMAAIKMCDQREAAEAADVKKITDRQTAKDEMRQLFDGCRDGCGCSDGCKAAGLVLCLHCDGVKKSKCMIRTCKEKREAGDLGLVAIPKNKAPTKRSRESDGEEEDDWMMEDDVDDDDESDCESDDGDDDGGNTNCPLDKPNSILIICGLLQFIIPKENL